MKVTILIAYIIALQPFSGLLIQTVPILQQAVRRWVHTYGTITEERPALDTIAALPGTDGVR